MNERSLPHAGFGTRGFNITFLILRLALGGLMFEAGLTKLISGTFTAAGFLEHSTGPIAGFYTNIAGNATLLSITDTIVPWGELLVGIAIILGIAIRFASFWGISMMLLYYTAFLPPENGWISQQIIFAVVFLTFMFTGIGYFLGLDQFATGLERQRHPLRILLG